MSLGLCCQALTKVASQGSAQARLAGLLYQERVFCLSGRMIGRHRHVTFAQEPEGLAHGLIMSALRAPPHVCNVSSPFPVKHTDSATVTGMRGKRTSRRAWAPNERRSGCPSRWRKRGCWPATAASRSAAGRCRLLWPCPRLGARSLRSAAQGECVWSLRACTLQPCHALMVK